MIPEGVEILRGSVPIFNSRFCKISTNMADKLRYFIKSNDMSKLSFQWSFELLCYFAKNLLRSILIDKSIGKNHK